MQLQQQIMSYYRQSPSRSPYRSPVKVLESEREQIREEMNLQRSIQREVQSRHLSDQLSLLRIRLRKMEELEVRNDGLISQNLLLKQENQVLGRDLAQRKYESERFRATSIQLQQRETIKVGELANINRNLEYELDLLRKERNQSIALYEAHINKLQIALQEKIVYLDSLSAKHNKLLNDKEMSEIRASQEIIKLKTLMARNSHQIEAEFEYKREKQYSENLIETENLKKNHASQIAILQDQIKKLSGANSYKSVQFEGQLNQNRKMRARFEDEVRGLMTQNDVLRERMQKLEQLNRTDIERIQSKYCDHHMKDTTALKEELSKEMHTLLEQIDKLKWLLNEKNLEIQSLIREKREQRKNSEDRELQLTSAIETLKNKLRFEEQSAAKENQSLMERINSLSDKLLRQSQGYHQRVKSFNKRINDLEAEIMHKQSTIDKNRKQHQLILHQAKKVQDEYRRNLQSLQKQHQQAKIENNRQRILAAEYKKQSESIMTELNKLLKQLEVKKETLQTQLERTQLTTSHQQSQLNTQINSLKQRVRCLQEKLSHQQNKHSKEMADLADKVRKRTQELQATQKKTIHQIQVSNQQQIQAFNLRIQKLNNDKQNMENQLRKYVNMYDGLSKFFENPHEGTVFQQKGENNVFEVLSKVTKSSVHIF